MVESRKRLSVIILMVLACVGLLAWPAVASLLGRPASQSASAQVQQCTALSDPKNMSSPALINFDTLPDSTVIGNSYEPSFGVVFENSGVTRALIYGNEPTLAHSSPNVAINNAVFPNTSSGVPMRIMFDTLKTQVGMYIGNGDIPIAGALSAYDSNNTLLCTVRVAAVPSAHTQFMGLQDPDGRIKYVLLDYGQTSLSESIDDLYFSPRPGAPPVRRPEPTWTPVPTAVPTAGPAPTPTAVVPMFSFSPIVASIVRPAIILPDFSIHGIEITQGIQCFNTAQGLATCPDNSLPVVVKKDAAARIYLKGNNTSSYLANVPVRLYIRANNVWYTADSAGRATSAIDQALADSANVYFNVNFSNDVVVDFYAVVDPNNIYTESNEGNNRFPAAGYITLTFRRRNDLKIAGDRLHYHPSGYAGTQNAGGWAVNGGGADWFEQVLPMRNNGINYSVRSGYLDWTENLGSGDAQHDLIRTLNAQWILENVLSFWFSGAFTGVNHVYGWAPNAGYSGGHADMPIYPHAGGLGVVGIGSDNPGTNTDNPASGALIFGHELTHDYNVYHTNTPDACGSNDGNSNFPYSSSSIQEFGFNPFTGKIYNPSNTHDLMSYCPSGGSKQGWISPFTWTTMFNKLSPPFAMYQPTTSSKSPFVFSRSAAGEALVVNATIFNPALNPPKLGQLNDLYRVGTDVAYFLPQGDYSVQLRDSIGTVLYSQPFTITFNSEYSAHSGTPASPDDPPPFPPEPTSKADVSFVLPWMDGTASIALVHLQDVLDERFVSPNAPQVFITNPSQAEAWAAGSTHTLEWQGLDLDGDALTYAVSYSRDAGASWILLQDGLSTPSYDIHVDDMAGGSDVRFRVVASDGVNTGQDETDQAITIPNHPPVVTILNPASGGIYLPGSLVVLQGTGTDMEDGGLPDEALVWSSDRQGGLGIGPSVPLTNLANGEHVITLTGVDSYNIATSTTIHITIAYPNYLPVLAK